MALELVGGALLSVSLQILFERLASPELLAYLRGKYKSKRSDFDELLRKFKSELSVVRAVLDDAERKQTTSRSIEEWLDMLQQVLFDAEDLLDEIETDDLQLKVEAESTASSSKVRKSKREKIRNFFSRSDKSNSKEGDLESEINKILERLEHIAKQVPVLNLVVGAVRERPTWRPLPTTSLVDESGVYGRDDDKKAIMKLLLSHDAGDGKVAVVPIVGLGGVGKTTLAQAVYNDVQVQKHFELKAWVCVSDDFDAFRVIKALLQSFSPSSSCDKIKELNLLQVKLKETLSGKKFLIVLDDVWNEKYEDWENLKKPFIDGAQGSKIIVTTRSKEVASIMGTSTARTYDLEALEKEACWQLFAKHAFGDDGFNADPNLQRIGREIVKKCKGLPLAAKTLAGLLRSTRDVAKWEGISSNEIWELPDDRSNILAALRLSYHYLPSHLKRCFAYCSIFPKDFEFEKEDLVLLWMAEDLLVHPKRGKRIEDVGNEYFDDLLCRSFFQRSGAKESRFVMHDLMNDLAKFVSRKYCFRLENGSSDKAEMKTRHLACTVTWEEGHVQCETFKSTIEATCLRTFLQLGNIGRVCSLIEVVLKSRCLRVLSFSRFTHLMELLDSIGKLRHLRYLDLSHTSFSRLPESICMLYNLQTLKLKDCRELTKLPDSIGEARHLRYLDLSDTSINRLPESICMLYNLQTLKLKQSWKLTKLPDSIGEARHLRYLDLSLTSISRLPESICMLYNLQTLKLKKCWNLTKLPDSIGDARDLRYVDLSETSINGLPESICMLYNLQTLKLKECWKLTKLPTDSHHLVNLRFLDVEGCNQLEEMPKQMGKLKNLQMLSIFIVGKDNDTKIEQLGELSDLKGGLRLVNLQNVVSATDASGAKLRDKCLEELEFEWSRERGYSEVREGGKDVLDNLMPTIALKKLHIKGYGDRRFSKWLGDQLFCNIIDINLSDCKYCDNLPPLGKLPSLRCLEISGFDGLVRVGPEFYGENGRSSFVSLEILTFGQMSKWEEWSIPFDDAETFPKLKKLSIRDCEKLIGDLPRLLPSLKQLSIEDCPQLASSLPMMPEVNDLCLVKCNRLIGGYDVIETLGCLEDLRISTTCSRSLPATLKMLRLDSCENLEIPLLQSYDFPNLTQLEINFCENLITSSSSGIMSWDPQRHPNLTTFEIMECDGVESFPEEGLLPTTITKLLIFRLHKLKTLDTKGLQQLTSLKSLSIVECKELKSISEDGLPLSLEELHITECPLLEAKCEKEKGEYWNKISYILKIYINRKLISS